MQAAQADTLAECQQKLMDGTYDLNQYLQCIANSSTTSSSVYNTSGNNNNASGRTVTPVSSTTTGYLPTTGSSSGRFVGIGAALIVLGGAALYGATRSKREGAPAAEVPESGSDG